MHAKEFRFAPREYVVVSLYGLDFPGRVLHVAWHHAEVRYVVEFVRDGNFIVRDFYEDEIKTVQRPAEAGEVKPNG